MKCPNLQLAEQGVRHGWALLVSPGLVPWSLQSSSPSSSRRTQEGDTGQESLLESSIPFILVIVLCVTIAALGNCFVIPQLQESQRINSVQGWMAMDETPVCCPWSWWRFPPFLPLHGLLIIRLYVCAGGLAEVLCKWHVSCVFLPRAALPDGQNFFCGTKVPWPIYQGFVHLRDLSF